MSNSLAHSTQKVNSSNHQNLNRQKVLTVGSLFSGIGGIDLGLQWAGFETIWFCEIDQYCQRVLRKHWPGVPIYDDARTIGAANLARPDVLVGGFPCQPHSLAGKRQGSADERDLWGEFARLIGELRPRWVLAENTPGLLSSEDGRFFGRVLRDLASFGYDAEWDCVPAFAIGAPHIRDRVFLIAYPNGLVKSHGILQKGRLAMAEKGTTGFWGFNRYKSQVAPGPTAILQSWQRGAIRQSPLVRVDDGIPDVLDRLRAVGNAVVPQVAEYIGRLIMEAATWAV